MAKLRFEIVTAEQVVYSDEVDVVIVPGIEGELAILPHHAPLMTMLQTGELRVRKEGEEASMFVSGGFLEVRRDKVIVLADVAERAEEIDIALAEEAKRRAEEGLKLRPAEVDKARAEAALRRSLVRLKIAEKRKKRRPEGRP
jgi:F-type H+-transporting ATPase subunit epsilon